MTAPHLKRMVDERADLVGRIERLDAFLRRTDTPIDSAERERMQRQLAHMRGYLIALDDRLDAAGVAR